MNKEQLQQKIVEFFEKLPKEAQDVFSSMGWMETLKTIGVNYKLRETQMELLGTETTLVLLGIIHVDEYRKIIETELELSEEIVKEISTEINDNILKTIKDKLVYAFEANAISLSEEKIDTNFVGLPKEVQTAIANSNWKEKLYEIAGKYKLTVSQMGMLEEITIKVMNNEIKPSLYENELATKITILREDISSLVNDINEGILKKIREVMREGSSKQEVVSSKENDEEEIPLPPYIVSSKQEVVSDISSKEEKMDIPPLPPQAKPAQIEINNLTIPVAEPKNIVDDKLKGVVVSDHSVSDYSIPKVSTPETEGKPKSFDPYREQF